MVGREWAARARYTERRRWQLPDRMVVVKVITATNNYKALRVVLQVFQNLSHLIFILSLIYSHPSCISFLLLL